MKKILIDTDIGDDVDDALAIALALESEEIDIVGITTVFKNVYKRAELTCELLRHYGRSDIPVYPGIGIPINNKVDIMEIPKQCEVLSGDKKLYKDMHGVDFIIETVKKDPSVIIVPIGAMTNIAVAYLKAPEIMKNAKIVSMGGVFSVVYPEWNILCDPEAAKCVIESDMDITLIGLDVTTKCVLNEKDINNIKNNNREQSKFLMSLIQKWFDKTSHNVTLHDPLVIGYLIDNSFLTIDEADIAVETSGEYSRAATIKKIHAFTGKMEESSTKIATAVDNNRFVDFFVKRVFY